MLLPPMCRFAVDGEERHPGSEGSRYCSLHPGDVRFVDPRIDIPNEIVIEQGHRRTYILREAVPAGTADGYLTVVA